MITRVTIRNFRSIREAELELAAINVFYGPTASGKSSILYALLVLKNFIANPNRSADAFFDFGFANLGGFEACVADHDVTRTIAIACELKEERGLGRYSVKFGPAEAEIVLGMDPLVELHGRVTLPYPVSRNFTATIPLIGAGEVTVNWNGLAVSVATAAGAPEAQEEAERIERDLNRIVERLRETDIAPQRRGFYKPTYSPTPLSPLPWSDDEVASIILSDQNLAPKISVLSERIVGRDFRIHTPLGTAMAFLQTTEKATVTPSLLVNDGFGVNQVVYLLAKLLNPKARVILIEEPEVHLHPTVQRNLAREICRIVREERKQVLLTTHSETFVSSLLALVAEGGFSAGDLALYFCEKQGRESRPTRQKVNEAGQVEGGLRSFIEAELEDLRKILKI
ncbi:MAG: AAA family ATPase [Bryobacterales bacterium]|nr:AAA family ATPase [Bryobacterales bacterium]